MGHQLEARLTERMAMDMEPEHVAEAIQMAVDGKRIGYVLGTSARLWSWLDRLLPESGRRRLVRYLTAH
jgi:hypothetical protein